MSMAKIAESTVETPKAARYVKALYNHFEKKAQNAEYTDGDARIQFGFGRCQMKASENSVYLHVEADDEDNFGRLKDVVGGHLERFSGSEALEVTWTELNAE